MKSTLLIAMLLITSSILAQEFRITSIKQERGNVLIEYTIDPKFQKERYRVDLYASHDNFSQPLAEVSGDLQGEIGGLGKLNTITWNAQRELKEFDGTLSFELRGEVVYLPIHTMDEISAKRKQMTTISWNGGDKSDRVGIDLISDGEVVERITEVPNTGSFEWSVDPGLKGSGYQIRFQNLTNAGEFFETDPFKISGGLPLGLTIGSGALGLGGLAALAIAILGDEPLPGPPEPN